MTFRDDHDAAIARADALEVELERAKAERDALKDELAKRPPPEPKRQKSKKPRRPKPAPKSETSTTSSSTDEEPPVKGTHMVIFMAITFGILAIILVPAALKGCDRQAKHEAWEASVKARQKHAARWRHLISVEPCVRDVALDTVGPVSRRRPEVYDPRRDHDNFGYDLSRVAENCGYPVREITNDPTWPATVREPLRAWMNAETELTNAVRPLDAYLSNRDWQEDDYRGGQQMWATLLAIVAKRDAALAAVRAKVLPVLRDEIQDLADAHLKDHGGTRDETWWRVELGLAQWAIDEIALEAGGIYAGHDFDTAAATPKLQLPVAALIARSAEAPIEVRRQLRNIEWITKPLAAGQVPMGETPLWHLTHPEADLISKLRDEAVIPAMPPDPGPEPEYSDD